MEKKEVDIYFCKVFESAALTLNGNFFYLFHLIMQGWETIIMNLLGRQTKLILEYSEKKI